jgi:indole-3-acetate monooxygenase
MAVGATDTANGPAAGADALLAAVEEIGPLLREHAAAGEAARRPTAVAMDAAREAGLFRLFTPRSLGGLEVDPVTCARVIEAAARFDSETAGQVHLGVEPEFGFVAL